MPSSMLHEHGWSGINFNSPFADMAILLGLNWLAILLYMEAVVSRWYWGFFCCRYWTCVTRYGRKWAYS